MKNDSKKGDFLERKKRLKDKTVAAEQGYCNKNKEKQQKEDNW